MKKFLSVIMILFISLSNVYANDVEDIKKEEIVNEVDKTRYKAKVKEASNVFIDEISNIKYQELKIEILTDSEYKEKEFNGTFSIQALDSKESDMLDIGDIVYAHIDVNNKDIKFIVEDLDRIPYVIFVFVLFIAVILLIGRKQGLKTVVSLLATILAIIYIFIPMVINGMSAIFAAVLVSIVVAIVTFVLIAGFSKKSIVSMIGTICGVIIGALIAFIISYLGRITGLSDEHSQMLIYITKDMVIDINGIFFSGIIIGTIGATMDIAMSISSSMEEITFKVKDITGKQLIKSGLNIGRDVMGTMSNTLILAYVGSSINIILIYILNNYDIIGILNSDFIASEILRSLCSTIGMILTIPITTYIYSLAHKYIKPKIIVEKVK